MYAPFIYIYIFDTSFGLPLEDYLINYIALGKKYYFIIPISKILMLPSRQFPTPCHDSALYIYIY